MKVYKRSIYWVNTQKYCGAVAKDQDGYVYMYDTAPCYRWAAKRKMKFSDLINYYKRKNWLINCKKLEDDVDQF